MRVLLTRSPFDPVRVPAMDIEAVGAAPTARSSSMSPSAWWPKRKSSPTTRVANPELGDEQVLDELAGPHRCELR